MSDTKNHPEVHEAPQANMYFDLADNDVFINYHNHIEYNPGFQQMIHLQSEKEGADRHIRIDLRNRYNQVPLQSIHLRRVLRYLKD